MCERERERKEKEEERAKENGERKGVELQTKCSPKSKHVRALLLIRCSKTRSEKKVDMK